MSYHYESKARLHQINFLKEKENFSQTPKKAESVRDLLNRIKILAKIAYEKMAYINSAAESYKAYPKRFET